MRISSEVKKTLTNAYKALINFLTLTLVSREDVLSALRKLGLSYGLHSILTNHEKWQQI